MELQYVPFCPHGDICKQGGKRLGAFFSEEAAREKVAWHLEYSSYHYFSKADAQEASMQAHIDVEDYEPPPEEPAAEDAGKGSKNKSRPAPYQGKSTWGKGKGKIHQAMLQHDGGSSSSGAAVQPVTSVAVAGMRLENQAIRCEAAARQAAKFARQAAVAFDEEADNLRALIDEIRRTQ